MKKIISIIALLVAMIGTASASNTLSAASVEGRLSVSMVNDVTVTAYDFHLYLPEGAAIGQKWNEDDEEYVNDVTMSRTKSDHALTLMKDSKDGSFLFGVASPTSKTLKNSDGEILSIALDLSKVSDGTYNCSMKKIWFAESGTSGVAVDDVNFDIEVKDGALVSVITGIESVEADGMQADGKYLKAGHVIIKKGNRIFNAVGGIVK